MQNANISGTVAASVIETRCTAVRGVVIGLLMALLAACSPQKPPTGSDTSLHSLHDGVALLATDLVTHATLPPPPPSGRYLVVVDPWIDMSTGSQVATTKLMQQEIETLAPQHFPVLELLPFTPENLARRPVVLLGAIEPVAGPGAVEPSKGPPGAWRVYGILADLGTGKVASGGSVWVQPGDIDPTPTPFFRDSPVWQPDDSVIAYLRTLDLRPGSQIDEAYLKNLRAEALIVSANDYYGQQSYRPARALYLAAATLPEGGHQLRVANGLYLTSWALHDRSAARQAFTTLVDDQIRQGHLAVKFLFRPDSTTLWSDPNRTAPYQDWLRVIATRAVAQRACLRLTGHTSSSGSAEANDRLSLARAISIKQDLIRIEPRLRDRITTRGVGSREVIVGTGKDDETDLVDRRVEFDIEPCGQTVATR